ncbi:cytoskeletal protein Sojo-like isoform X2 [Haliotis rufescens]|uniref:cytoskeletal protein Sojo-like isoform X2 n=1 Tax=Haliotis rufescens TaxID=6454 RepID=UPI00201EA488|nr:cytoskeletal protein Sojo-like isoform X2 [Haliotis rufescens]
MSASVFILRASDLFKGKGKSTKKKKRHKDADTQNENAEVGEIKDVVAADSVSAKDSVVTPECKPSTSNGCGDEDGKSIETSDTSSVVNDVEPLVSVNDYKAKVEGVKNKLKSSKTLIDNESKSTEQKIVRTGFWDKLRFTMSQSVTDEQAVTECRRMFREEMVRLRREVEEFRELCLQQIKVQKQCVDDHRRTCEKEITALVPRNGFSRRLSVVSEEGSLRDELKEELKEMETSMEFFQQKQKILDQEMELLNKEDELSKKQKDLEEYEKEIQEVESLLNQRQAICDRRQKHLVVLDEELQSLRQDLEESKEQMQQEVAANGTEHHSERARKNCALSPRLRGEEDWDIVRRNLMDKQHLLEATVQKYRSELASASSNIAGKEILIGKLQQQLTETEGMVIVSEKKIKQLETKLAFSVTEGRILEEQLHGVNRKNSINISPDDLARRGSFFHRQTSSDPSGSKSAPKSPLLRQRVNDLHGDDRHPNGGLSPRSSSLSSPQGSSVIRRRSMRSNSVAGDTLSKYASREAESEGRGSGACTVM